MKIPIQELPTNQLNALISEWSDALQIKQGQNLKLDLSRGKPSHAQLELSHKISNQPIENYFSSDGTDTRNYGNLTGIAEARALGAKILGTSPETTYAIGNSSLSLMHLTANTALHHGLWNDTRKWANSTAPKMITLVPGYDRHFTVCDSLGIEMVNVKMDAQGPDITKLESLVEDPSVKGIWCVPKYSNPTGITYSDEQVTALANLPNKAAAEDFVIFWDNAYAIHDIQFPGDKLASIAEAAELAGSQDHIVQFASTSKVTFASGGIAFISSSPLILEALEKQISSFSIGSDKVNQLRHAQYLMENLEEHMKAHADLLAPKFSLVLESLENDLGELEIAKWTEPKGGYFISLDTALPVADQVIELAKTAGLVLTPAGATYPAGTDEENTNIRIAPSFAEEDELKTAMEVLTLCARLITAREVIKQR